MPTIMDNINNWYQQSNLDFDLNHVFTTPVSSKGHRIGFIDTSSRPCDGVIKVYSAYADAVRAGVYPPSTWTVPDLFGTISVGEWCAKKGLVPSWAKVSGNTVSIPSKNSDKGTPDIVYVQTPSGQLNTSGQDLNLLPPLTLPSLNDTTKNVLGSVGMGTVIFGGGLLAILLLSRR